MAKISSHCKDCLEILGKDYREVHEWLDNVCSIFPFQIFSDYHRSFRHNSYGVKIWRSVSFGHELAVRLHLIRDYDMVIVHHEYKDNIDKIMRKSNKALVFFNNLENFEVVIPHLFVDDTGLVAKAVK